MREEELAVFLMNVVNNQEAWHEDFDGLTLHPEQRELCYNDSGVGEEYVMRGLNKEWPGSVVDVDSTEGCSTCGYGRTVTLTFAGPYPWLP